MYVKWKLILFRLEIVLISVQVRFTVCAECTIGLKPFWTHLMVLQRGVGQVEARFRPFGDCINLNAGQEHGLR
jgi:hypothetical protein